MTVLGPCSNLDPISLEHPQCAQWPFMGPLGMGALAQGLGFGTCDECVSLWFLAHSSENPWTL